MTDIVVEDNSFNAQVVSEQEHLKNIQEQLLLERLQKADNADDTLLILQALSVINGKSSSCIQQMQTSANIPEMENYLEYLDNKKERNDMTTNEQIEAELSEANGLLEGFIAIVKWLNSQLLNATFGITRQCWKLIRNIPIWIKNAFTKGIPWIFRKLKQFGKFMFSDKFMKMAWNLALLLPLLVLMLAVMFWPFGVYFFVCKNGWWLAGAICWSVFFGAYGAIQGWKRDLFGKTRNAIMKKTKKYNSEYFSAENVLKRTITGEK